MGSTVSKWCFSIRRTCALSRGADLEVRIGIVEVLKDTFVGVVLGLVFWQNTVPVRVPHIASLESKSRVDRQSRQSEKAQTRA